MTWPDIRHLLLISVLASAGFEFASQSAWGYAVALFASMFLLQWVRRDERVKTVEAARDVVNGVRAQYRRGRHH